MTGRPLRDIEAEAMRRERLGLMRPLWADMPESDREEWRRRADHMARIRSEICAGISPVDIADGATIVSNVIVRNPGFERCVQRHGDAWDIVVIDRKTQEEKAEQTFTLHEAGVFAGMVLSEDPDALKRAGLGKLLSAAVEIYALAASGGQNE